MRALCLGACLVVVAGSVAGSVGCQALYGGKPEKMRNPERKKKPEEATEKAAEVKYIEECTTNFRDDPKLAKPEPSKANAIIGDGDAVMAQVPKAKDAASGANLIIQGIERYRSALTKDPYNTEATLKLALAYDMVYRKGCALALLKRISQLESNPKFKPNAKRIADEVAETGTMFKGYRQAAVQAVGR